ncbi:DUF1934 domain-containing protein [Oceanobacillus bengalensis]|uniref:DUF1934 domain-containing protein n=1 Tax=Oceanobacillus bengalensis TaxID=1435466 RepID=A0A494YYT9_9BACI|nr:DUF1934 domain-containing protein [Oceanobacillus bengalensis]RKQ15399.1 DUF1934 domain-containing protein [Oceanobacillus bengalensis]
MDSGQMKVAITLQTTIEDNGNKEYNKVQETGTLFRKGKIDVITFEEKTEEQAVIKNFITLQEGKVNIKRTGLVSMNQRFHANQITENVYKHPHGTLHMETFTKKITYHSDTSSNEGKLMIDYTVKLNGQDERKHELMLVYIEEDPK